MNTRKINPATYNSIIKKTKQNLLWKCKLGLTLENQCNTQYEQNSKKKKLMIISIDAEKLLIKFKTHPQQGREKLLAF